MSKAWTFNPAKGYKGPGGGRAIPRGGMLPDPTSGEDFATFITADTIGKVGTRAVLIVSGAPVVRRTDFSDVQVPVTYKRANYVLGVSFSKMNYTRLVERFGKNPKKWRGKIEVEIKYSQQWKKSFIAVVS